MDFKGRSQGRPALDFDLTAVVFNDPFADRQPQAQATFLDAIRAAPMVLADFPRATPQLGGRVE